MRRVDAHPVAADVMQMLVVSEQPEAFLPDMPVSEQRLRPASTADLTVAIRPRTEMPEDALREVGVGEVGLHGSVTTNSNTATHRIP